MHQGVEAMSPAELAAAVVSSHSSTVPVDIYRIIRAHGIIIRNIRVDPNDFNGLYMRVRGRPVILLNSAQPGVRRRFTAAHELYHHFEAQRGAWDGRPVFDSRPRSEMREEIREERQANRFAGALLIPQDALREVVQRGLTVQQIARFFGVSVDATVIRLRDLGIHDVQD